MSAGWPTLWQAVWGLDIRSTQIGLLKKTKWHIHQIEKASIRGVGDVGRFFWLWFGGEMWGNAIHLQKLFWNQGFVISRCTHIRTGSGSTWHLKKIADLTWRRPPGMAVFTEKFEQVARLNLRLHKQPHDIAWGNVLGSALGICKRLALRNCIRVHLRIRASQISTWNRTISTKAFLGQSVISVISDMYIETLKTIPNDPVGSWQQPNGCITFYPDINIAETQFQNPKQNPGCFILKREGRRIHGPINNVHKNN